MKRPTDKDPPQTLLGYPLVVLDELPSISSGVIVFGGFVERIPLKPEIVGGKLILRVKEDEEQ